MAIGRCRAVQKLPRSAIGDMTPFATHQERNKKRLPESRFLLLWLFIQPRKWIDIEAELLRESSYRALSFFSWGEMSDPAYGRRLLRQNFGINLFMISVVIGLTISFVVPLSVESSIFMRLANAEFVEIPAGWVNGLAFGISFAIIAGLFFSLFHSVALGVAVPAIGIIFFGIAWGLSWDFGALTVFGFVGGVIGRLALVTAPATGIPQKSIAVEIATVMIGVVVGFVILLTVTTLPVVLMLGTVEDTGLRFGVIYGLIMGLTASAVYILLHGFQFRFDWGHSRFIFLLLTLGCTLIGTLFGVRNYFAATDLVVSIVIGMQTANVAALLFFLANHFATLLGGPRAGAIAAGVTAGVGGVFAFAFSFNPQSRPGNWGIITFIAVVSTTLGLTSHLWRPILIYPLVLIWNLTLFRREEQRIDESGHRMRRHSAFWDQHQWLPLIGLDDYLIMLLEKMPELGQQGIEAIVGGHQRWAARAAQIEFDARRLEAFGSLEEIAGHTGLTTDNSRAALHIGSLATPIVQAFAGIQRDVAAALAQSSRYNRKMVLLEAVNRTNNLLFELTRSDERYGERFRPIANRWLQLINERIDQLDQGGSRSEIVNPYVVGVPLTRKQQLFVGRVEVGRRLEELLREQDHPPFLLYGQRRMGKTSLLYQLRWLLPDRIIPLTVDLQGPVALARDEAGFLYNFVKQMVASAGTQGVEIPPLTRESLREDPFTLFNDWLDQVEHAVSTQGGETVLLCLDEFEALGRAFENKTLREDAILSMLRHLIQHRTRFKLLLAGSHLLESFPSWSSYLINVETIKLGCLDDAEARLLIEKPISDFNLVYAPEAVDRVLTLTNGHPYLLQLLCAEIVNAKNEGPESLRFKVHNRADVEAVVPQVLVRGRQFFVDMEQNQFPARTLPLLMRLAAEPAGYPVPAMALEFEDEQIDLLLSRGYIEKRGDRLLLPIELIRMWLLRSE